MTRALIIGTLVAVAALDNLQRADAEDVRRLSRRYRRAE